MVPGSSMAVIPVQSSKNASGRAVPPLGSRMSANCAMAVHPLKKALCLGQGLRGNPGKIGLGQ